jgi:ABC-2 type transport system permease protein
LPFSDGQSIFAKLTFGLVVAPLFTWMVATVAWLFAVFIYCATCAAYGNWIFGALFLKSTIYLAPLSYLLLLPVYIVWALPMIGWLFMVSSYFKKNAQTWGFGLPLIALGISYFLKLMDGLMGVSVPSFSQWLSASIVHELGRVVGGVIPGFWFLFNQSSLGFPQEDGRVAINKIVEISWLNLGQLNVWIGASIGLAMILIATRLRRYSETNK